MKNLIGLGLVAIAVVLCATLGSDPEPPSALNYEHQHGDGACSPLCDPSVATFRTEPQN